MAGTVSTYWDLLENKNIRISLLNIEVHAEWWVINVNITVINKKTSSNVVKFYTCKSEQVIMYLHVTKLDVFIVNAR